MPIDSHLPGPSLRTCIEDVMETAAHGITARILREQLAQPGGPKIGPQELLRTLGQLLVEGRVDECAGVWMLCDADADALRPHARSHAA
jgi:hypothetical protein